MEPKEKRKRTKIWSWNIDEVELKNQVENYRDLGIKKSYRGQSVLIVSASMVFGLLISFQGDSVYITTVILGLILYVPILFFVYKGHRWAIVALMILFAIDKGFTIYEVGGTGIVSGLIISYWIMGCFWKCLQVENERRRLALVLKDISDSTM